MADDSPITNEMLLEHMRAGFQEIEVKFLDEIAPMKKDIQKLKEAAVESQRNHKKTHDALQRLYGRRVEMSEKIDKHDEQLEDHGKRIKMIEKTLVEA